MFDAIGGMILQQLTQFFNPALAAAIVAIIEVAKHYIPDNIEPKVLPALSVALAVGIGLPFMHLTLIVCIATGVMATGGYAVVKNLVQNVGINGLTAPDDDKPAGK